MVAVTIQKQKQITLLLHHPNSICKTVRLQPVWEISMIQEDLRAVMPTMKILP